MLIINSGVENRDDQVAINATVVRISLFKHAKTIILENIRNTEITKKEKGNHGSPIIPSYTMKTFSSHETIHSDTNSSLRLLVLQHTQTS